MGALSKLDQFLLNAQVRTRDNRSENREATRDRSLSDPYPEVEFSACCTSNLTESDQEERPITIKLQNKFHFLMVRVPSPGPSANH